MEVSKEKQKSTESCVVLVGTTGTGKTTCLNIYTGNNLATGESALGVTKETDCVDDLIHQDGPKWLDNPGWSDAEGRSDSGIFKSLLRHLQDNQCYQVKCVVWCVMPTPRMDAVLQEQARFIHNLVTDDERTEENEEGRIWSNVLIVCKGKVSSEQAGDVQGAVQAAKRAFTPAEPRTIRYLMANSEVLAETGESFRKRSLRMLTPDEIRSELEAEFSQLPSPVTVVFANKRCRACGQTGDPRLMKDMCHRNKIRGHTGTLKQRFSKPVVSGSLGLGVAGGVALGVAAAVTAPMALVGLPFLLLPGLTIACHRLLNTPSDQPAPCGVKITDMRWSCCRQSELSPGCTDVCDNCGQVWGSGQPCVHISTLDINAQRLEAGYEVVRKEHDLVSD